MRGADYFDEQVWAEAYNRHVGHFRERQTRNGRDFTLTPMSRDEYDRIFQDLNSQRRDQLRQLERQREQEANYDHVPDLDTDALKDRSTGRPTLPPFKLHYDTIEEVRMRLRQTVIFIKGHPFYCFDCQTNRKNPDVDGRFKLVLEDRLQKHHIVPLDRATDLRGMPPGYVVKDGQVGYLNRIPARVNTQGMTPHNTVVRKIGTYGAMQFNLRGLVELCAPRKTVKFSEGVGELIAAEALTELRLDDNVAVFTKPNTEKLFAEYKGRRIGEIKENCVIADDPDDFVQPWIVDDLRNVNLEIKEG